MTTRTCGDCGAVYPLSATRCTRPFDDYLALRGGSIESAMERALAQHILRLKQIEQQYRLRAALVGAANSTFAVAA